MKKLALTSLIAMFAFTGAHAATNHFVGGSATIALDSDHATVLSVAPEIGWKYNSDWDVGVMANFGYQHDYPAVLVDADAYTYGVGGFARYKVAQMGGVKLLLKGSIGADFLTVSPEDDNIDSETAKRLAVSVIPMVTYDVSESFTLYANLNFLGVYAGYTFENKDLGVKDGWRLGAVADTDNLINTNNFQVGFTYNF